MAGAASFDRQVGGRAATAVQHPACHAALCGPVTNTSLQDVCHPAPSQKFCSDVWSPFVACCRASFRCSCAPAPSLWPAPMMPTPPRSPSARLLGLLGHFNAECLLLLSAPMMPTPPSSPSALFCFILGGTGCMSWFHSLARLPALAPQPTTPAAACLATRYRFQARILQSLLCACPAASPAAGLRRPEQPIQQTSNTVV